MKKLMGLIVLVFSVSTFLLLAIGVLDVWSIVGDEIGEKAMKTWFLLCIMLGVSLAVILFYGGVDGD